MANAFTGRLKLVQKDSQWDKLLLMADNAIEDYKAAVGEIIKNTAVATAPRESGYMASTIKHDGHGVVRVGAHYGMFVNFGTRYMMNNPFFSNAVAHQGLAESERRLKAMFGMTKEIGPLYVLADVAPFQTGQDRGARRSPAEYAAIFAHYRELGR